MTNSPHQADLLQPRPRSGRPILVGVLVVLLGLVAAVLGTAHVVGPRFGFWLVPPSPQRYAEVAVDHLSSGLYARGRQWEKARQQVLDAGANAKTLTDTHDAIAAATRIAGGTHSHFVTPEKASVRDQQDRAAFTPPTVTTREGITTVQIPELGTVSQEMQQQYADAAAHGIAAAAPTTCGWVVDLRGNRGGTMYPMITGLAPLLPDGPGLFFHAEGSPDVPVSIKDGGIALGSFPAQMTTPVKEKVTGQNVAVLYDDHTASSGEATATMFRGVDGVRSFGTPTAGYTSANSVIPMPDGARIVLTQSVYVDRDGVNLNEEPMQPDVVVPAEGADEAAAAWLRTGSCR